MPSYTHKHTNIHHPSPSPIYLSWSLSVHKPQGSSQNPRPPSTAPDVKMLAREGVVQMVVMLAEEAKSALMAATVRGRRYGQQPWGMMAAVVDGEGGGCSRVVMTAVAVADEVMAAVAVVLMAAVEEVMVKGEAMGRQR
ncbi:hypothetical protein Vretimale_9298 [Volvox reticuliferus]|uniref:Uncharacterized protein n=1 Tax=Volvox reticuliferus TaxID=1737510 RepID=A0A8J4LP94_9CHLO|nr:hypothetical protein Vretimale_9298 [Volvox reticuliferus]